MNNDGRLFLLGAIIIGRRMKGKDMESCNRNVFRRIITAAG